MTAGAVFVKNGQGIVFDRGGGSRSAEREEEEEEKEDKTANHEEKIWHREAAEQLAQ